MTWLLIAAWMVAQVAWMLACLSMFVMSFLLIKESVRAR